MHKQESKFCENCIFFKQTKKSLKNYSLRGANDTTSFFVACANISVKIETIF